MVVDLTWLLRLRSLFCLKLDLAGINAVEKVAAEIFARAAE